MKKSVSLLSATLLMSAATLSYAQDPCIDYLNTCWKALSPLEKVGLVGAAAVIGDSCLLATLTPPAGLACAEAAINGVCAVAKVSGSPFVACQASSAKAIYEWVKAKLPEAQQLQQQQKQQ